MQTFCFNKKHFVDAFERFGGDGLGSGEQVNALEDTNIPSKHMLAQSFVAAGLYIIICARIYACELAIARFGMFWGLIIRRKIRYILYF